MCSATGRLVSQTAVYSRFVLLEVERFSNCASCVLKRVLIIRVVFYNLVTFAMQENIEQRYAIKLCVKLNKSATETFASLNQAYGDTTLSRTMVFKWHKAFKEGRENIEDDPRSGRPISSTNDENVEVEADSFAITCRKVANNPIRHSN